jgi:tRNA nucleotidyltransferase/poly(A) polymerase
MQLIKINKHIQSNNSLNHIIDFCKEYKSKNRIKIYIVGGVIRDILLESKSNPNDLDLVIDGDIENFVKEFSDKFSTEILKAHSFLNYKLVLPDSLQVDIAHSRKEFYEALGKLPKWEKANIFDDLSRRDFSINSIALEIGIDNVVLIDPLGGLSDIKSSTIRILHDKSFIDDPTRIYRAIKYKARFDFTFDQNTKIVLQNSIDHVENISLYRKNNEILKFLDEPNIHKILELLNTSDIFRNLVPQHFMSKINFIKEDYWSNAPNNEKIFFSLFEVKEKERNLFLNSLNIPKTKMQSIISLIQIKEKLQKDALVDRKEINFSNDLISNLYHCL